MDDRVFHPYPNAQRAFFNDNRPEVCELAARGESLAAFDGRCIPKPPQRGCRVGVPGAGCVAPRSNTPGILGRRALPAGRLARLGATPDFHHGLLDAAADARAKTVAFFCGELKA